MNRVIQKFDLEPKDDDHTRGLLVLRGLNRELKLSASTTAWMISSSSSTAFSFPDFGGISI
jgi:hypothetical protein